MSKMTMAMKMFRFSILMPIFLGVAHIISGCNGEKLSPEEAIRNEVYSLLRYDNNNNIEEVFSYYDVSIPEDVTYKSRGWLSSLLFGTDANERIDCDTLLLYGLRNDYLWVSGYFPLSREKVFECIDTERTDTLITVYQGYGEYDNLALKSLGHASSLGHDKGDVFVMYAYYYNSNLHSMYQFYTVFLYNGLTKIVDGVSGCKSYYGWREPNRGYGETVFLVDDEDDSNIYCFAFNGDLLYTTNGPNALKQSDLNGDVLMDYNYYSHVIMTSEDTYVSFSYDYLQGTDYANNLYGERLGVTLDPARLWTTRIPNFTGFKHSNRNDLVVTERNDDVWTLRFTSTSYEGAVADTTFFVNVSTGEYVDEVK